jgi:hypothetical protein
MKAAKTLGRPENWQDFESLCKKLWGEIWKCQEIMKNGRSGQNQSGVDVYGIPSTDDEYYGIQCKGKDEYTKKQLTEAEIDDEISKAKTFEPSLKKFYFTTTAVKDAKIEAVVRKKNIEHKKAGLFEVHLFSWEDIVDLIHENEETYNYYVKSLNFKSNKSVAVTFHDGSTEIMLVSKFKKKITDYRQKIVPANPMFGNPLFDAIRKQEQLAKIVIHPTNSTTINYSYCQFYLKIHNTGSSSLEDYKLMLEFDGEIQELADTNEKSTGFLAVLNHFQTNTILSTSNRTGKIIPSSKVLVGDDYLDSDHIFIKPGIRGGKTLINWKLLSKDFKDSGTLELHIETDVERDYVHKLVEDPLKVRMEEGEIEDYICEKESEDDD